MQFSSGYPDVLDRPKSRITIPEPTPASLATWLAELPLANVDYCSDAVLAVLQAFNAKPDFSAQIRFDLAEVLRPCAAMLAQQTEGCCQPIRFTPSRVNRSDKILPAGTAAARHGDIGRFAAGWAGFPNRNNDRRILLDSWDCQRENIWNASTDGGSPMAGNGWEGELINTGSRGYGVLYCDKGNSHIQVGALVGISEHRRLPYIGIIRWLISNESCLQFGVELLSPNAEAVQLWDRSGKCRGQGLMLPAVPPLRSDPELLTAPTGFSTGTPLRLVGQKTRAGFISGKYGKRRSLLPVSN
jgi:hypothetical protein